MRKGVTPERNVGVIKTLLVSPDDERTTRALLAFALEHFWQAGVTFVTGAASIPVVRAGYDGLGFKITNHVTPMVRSSQEIPLDGCVFDKGDHDWDQFPLA